ncbi:MAG: hypothetical protein ABI444_13410 [Candidatus Kapaibacterium sp.]|jgi:hypothetical protein
MSDREFLKAYFVKRSRVELEFVKQWEEQCRPLFGQAYLLLKDEMSVSWSELPQIIEADDDEYEVDEAKAQPGLTSYLVRDASDSIARYYLRATEGSFVIEHVKEKCEVCGGTGVIDADVSVSGSGEPCEWCDGEGWSDVID